MDWKACNSLRHISGSSEGAGVMFALFRWNLRAIVLFAREMCSLFDTLGVHERLLRVDEGVKSVFSLRTSDKIKWFVI